jgi:hypothetical protein
MCCALVGTTTDSKIQLIILTSENCTRMLQNYSGRVCLYLRDRIELRYEGTNRLSSVAFTDVIHDHEICTIRLCRQFYYRAHIFRLIF